MPQFAVPDPATVIRPLLRLAPAALQTRLLTLAVNQLLRGQPLAAELAQLEGKHLRLSVEDIPLEIGFEIVAGGLRPSTRAPHVTIRGRFADFVALARREQDPDTLFFQRRLAVEGETETGLHLKNLLDGWEYDLPAHLRAVLPGLVASLTLHGLSRLRPAGNHHSSHPEAPPADTRPWRRPR